MEVNDELVTKLAKLARLEFHGAEKEEIKKDMRNMIAFIDKLNELDTSGVEPLLHMTNNINSFREDELGESISTEDALKNASMHDDVFFKVPKVISKK